MNQLIKRSLCLSVIATVSCAPPVREQGLQPARAQDQTANVLAGEQRWAEPAQFEEMGAFVGRYSSATGRLTFEPLLPQGAGRVPRPGYTQLLPNTVTLDDNGTAVGPGGWFGGEMCGAGQICAVVTMVNDSTRTIENSYVEIVDLTGGASVANGNPLGTNYPSSAGHAGGWNYGSIVGGGSESVKWRFNTAGGADFTFKVRVWGVYTRTGYAAGSRSTITTSNNVVDGNATWSDSSPAWRDACLFGTTLFSNTSAFTTASITPPFPFTLGDTTIDTDSWSGAVEVSSNGTISLMGVDSGDNLPLSDASAPDYTIFPYWDQLSTANGSVCAGLDPTSAAPNRRWVVTWKNVSLQSDSNTRLTFSVVMQEQSDNVYFLYHRWSGTPSNCSATNATQGSSATIGIRGNGSYTQIGYNTAMLGIHPSTCPGPGVYYKLTATPANP
jgi:hypothetical protein